MTPREAYDKAVGAAGDVAVGVPGLAFLAGGLTLPERMQDLLLAVIAIVTAATMGVVFVSRVAIEGWAPERVRRHLAVSGVLGVGLVLACFVVHGTVIAEVTVDGSATPLFVPAIADGGLQHPYLDCGMDNSPTCRSGGVLMMAESARAVADSMMSYGAGDIKIPEGPAHTVWTVGIVVVFALGAAALVYLAGLLRVRGLQRLADPATPPGPAPGAEA
ncbi:hypothetical protein [Rubrivirga sp. IMCC45206]|uniref:hypothetical protein n=1 Tax=Rubrivirga sp. IMCC45206 TaxID=3391614 RepID=UPI00398F8FE1